MLIKEAFAAGETAAVETNPMVGFLVQLILVFAIFYFLLIRPQQKKMKEHEEMLASIKPQDEIITGGGIYGRVIKAEAEVLVVEVSKGVEMKISRSSVREKISAK